MNNYTQYINALRACAKEHIDDRTPFAHIKVSMLYSDVADLLEALEVLEQEPKIGRWIKNENKYWWWYECDQCGSEPLKNDWQYELSPYCPNCGAKMEVGANK